MGLARDAARSLRLNTPYLLADRTNLAGGSSITLGDGRGQLAVVACVHLPPGSSDSVREARLREGRLLAEAHAAEAAAAHPLSPVARGVYTNIDGLTWAVPLPGAASGCGAAPGCTAGMRRFAAAMQRFASGAGRCLRCVINATPIWLRATVVIVVVVALGMGVGAAVLVLYGLALGYTI